MSLTVTTETGTFLAESAFRVLSTKELEEMSVCRVRNPESFNALGHPTADGLYSPKLGPEDENSSCGTCQMGKVDCPGHFGHIRLPLPVYHPILFDNLYEILLGVCTACDDFHVDPRVVACVTFQLKALNEAGDVEAVERLQALLGEHVACKKDRASSQEEMRAVYDEAVVGCSRTKSTRNIFHDRRIAPVQSRVCRAFVSNHMRKRPKRCKNCEQSVLKLVQELKNKILLRKENDAKKGPDKKAAKNKKPVVKNRRDDESDDELEMEEERKTVNDVLAVGQNKLLTPQRARDILRHLWKLHGEMLALMYPCLSGTAFEEPVDIFLVESLSVPPVRFRPLNVVGGRTIENPQSANLAEVLKEATVVEEKLTEMRKLDLSLSKGEEVEKARPKHERDEESLFSLYTHWTMMQQNVNAVYDSALNKSTTNPRPGVKQLLEKKSGLFRMNLMGKRVDFAARSVISPDPFIGVNEVGIPHDFAMKLTFREAVTPFNLEKLRRCVINGPDTHPGATHVEFTTPSGFKRVNLLKKGRDARLHRVAEADKLLTMSSLDEVDDDWFQGNKFVHRHLEDGDAILLNRQPTLHRPSIMAHRARVLPRERTLRLHYANCKSYNADFDGDEMNAHLPQDQLGRSEAYTLMSTERHYLVPKDATPLSGLIQDHIVAGVHLTVRGNFFEKGHYQQLVNMALIGHDKRIKVLPPCIVKPIPSWSGKQVISTILLNLIPDGNALLSLVSQSKVSPKNWSTHAARAWKAGGDAFRDPELDMSESRVIFRRGQLLCGVLDKAQYGGSSYGLVHAVYELYGGKVSSALLTSLARLFTVYLQYHGFTLGIGDIICTAEGDAARKEAAARAGTEGPKAMKAFFDKRSDDLSSSSSSASDLSSRIQRAIFTSGADDDVVGEIDHAMKSVTDEINNNITRAIIPKGLIKQFPTNNLQLMIQTGAKGSSVNGLQISALLGQIELEGRRPPLMLSCRTLPSFLPFDLTPRAGGFVDGRFLTGIEPQEYFFHCMAGREGLVDTAVKTSRSGYLQRCIIKHMEGISVAYDATVRDAADGSVVQFAYGEDGVDILATPYLEPRQFPFLKENVDVEKEKSRLETLKKSTDAEEAETMKREWTEKKVKSEKSSSSSSSSSKHKRFSAFLRFESLQRKKHGAAVTKEALLETWNELDAEIHAAFRAKIRKPPAPLDAELRPDKNFGVLREKLTREVEEYVKTLPESEASTTLFRDYLYSKAMRSLAQPGEPVGLLAAQSVGEPSTQMTLNTFHFAGRGEMNVTLGIPRLREILLVAGKEIKTPMMEAPFKEGVSQAQRDRLHRRMNKLSLSDVVEKVTIKETIGADETSALKGFQKVRHYDVTVSFLDPSQYADKSSVTISQIVGFLERVFFLNLSVVMEAKFEEIEKRGLLHSGTLKAARLTKEVVDDLDLGEGNLGGSADSDDEASEENKGRTVRQKREREDYGGEDEERNEMEGGEEEEQEEEDEGEEDGEKGGAKKADDDVKEDELSDDEEEPASKKQKKTQNEAKRRKSVAESPSEKSLGTWLKDQVDKVRVFEIDGSSRSPKWCRCVIVAGLASPRLDLGEIVKTEIKRSVVHKVRGISRGFLVEEKQKRETWLRTEGINIEEFARHEQFLDMTRFYTNDIRAMAEFFGVDAARRVLVREITNVFSVYGITVDPRHLSLISDYMTFDGQYKALNRLGIANNQSPLQKASFETSMAFLKTALIAGAKDDMSSPSSRIVTGRLVGSGTGCFDLRTDVAKATRHMRELRLKLKEGDLW